MTKPTLDFETKSEAGCIFDEVKGRWAGPVDYRGKIGLPAVGARVYAEHPTTEVLTASYDLCDGRGLRRWRPGQPRPQDLFDHVAAGRPLESHNAMFERLIWMLVCVRKYGWPPLNPYAQRCSMATARSQAYPGKLADLGDVLKLDVVKDKDGARLIDKFSKPRNPTKTDARRWVLPEHDPADFERLCAYCDRDVQSEQGVAARTDPMPVAERDFWFVDQEINWRGLAVDRPGLRACIDVMRQVAERYNHECRQITGFDVTQLKELQGWLAANGVTMTSMDADAIESTLAAPHVSGACRRVLELRSMTGSASVKKLFAMDRMAGNDDRLHDLFVHHGARTGRPTGAGNEDGTSAQVLNLPRGGVKLSPCGACGRPHHRRAGDSCPWCGSDVAPGKPTWKPEFVDYVLEIMAFRSLDYIEWFFDDALGCIQACCRGMITAGPGKELIASDYSAIEAVVAACLSGETWRIEAFERNDPIYLVGASKITGTPVQAYLDHLEQHGEHHPDRQTIGKVSELACGFGGWIGSYKAFGSTEDDDVIKGQILAWRAASPAIVEMWGGQWRGLPWERSRTPQLYGVEGMFVTAVQTPNTPIPYRGLVFEYQLGPRWVWDEDDQQWAARDHDKLTITLLSGRQLTYHEPQLEYGHGWAKDEFKLTYMTWNSNPKYGPRGWVRMNTYGGRLFENIVQATAHCIQRYGLLLARAAGYQCVLHVYDEDCFEVPEGTGSIEQVEQIMSTMPLWAVVPETGRPWPIRASGGWRGKRYRKG